MATLAITFKGTDEVSGAAQQVASDITDVGEAADKAAPQGSGFFSGMLSTATGFLAANVVGAIGSQIGSLVSTGFEDARNTQQLMAQTENIIKNTGGAAGMSAQQVTDLATSLSDAAGKSLFGDDQIQGAENVLLKFKELKGVVPDVTKLAVDMAQTLGTEPAAAAKTLGLALQDPFDASAKLAKQGVVLTEQQQAQLKAFKDNNDVAGAQKFLIEQLNTTYAGSAEAAAKSAGGMTQFKARMGEVAENLATAALPLLDKLAGVLNDYVAPAIELAAQWLGDNLPAAIAILQPYIDQAIALFANAGSSSDELSGVLGVLGDIWTQVAEIIGLEVQFINEAVIPTFKAIAAFLLDHKTEIMAILSSAWKAIHAAIDIALTLIKGIIKVALDLIHGNWEQAWEDIKEMSARIVTDLIEILRADFELLKTLFSGVVKWIVDEWHALPQQLADVGTAIVTAIQKGFESAWESFKSSMLKKLQDLRDQLPFSEPKNTSSPLYGLGKAGAAIVTMLQSGIDGAGALGVGTLVVDTGRPASGAASFGGRASSGGSGGSGKGETHYHIDARGASLTAGQFEAIVKKVNNATGAKALSRGRTGN